MKYLIIVILLSIFPYFNVFGMQLSEYEFEHQDILHRELNKKFPNFQGFNGSRQNMKIIGMKDEKLIRQEIDKIDLPSLVNNDPNKIKRKNLIKKLKEMNFTKDDLEIMGFDKKEIESEVQ